MNCTGLSTHLINQRNQSKPRHFLRRDRFLVIEYNQTFWAKSCKPRTIPTQMLGSAPRWAMNQTDTYQSVNMAHFQKHVPGGSKQTLLCP